MSATISLLRVCLLLLVLSVTHAEDAGNRPFADPLLDAEAQVWETALIERRLASSDPRQRYLGWIAATDGRLGEAAAAGLIARPSEEQMIADMAGADDPILWLWLLNSHRLAGKTASPQASALRETLLQRLPAQAPDLAHGWFHLLPSPETEGAEALAREVLRRAAEARDWRNGSADFLRAMLLGHDELPLPMGLREAPMAIDAGADVPGRVLPFIRATGYWAAYAIPAYQKLSRWCRRAGELGVVDSCVVIAEALAERGETLVDQMIGRRMRVDLAPLERVDPDWLLACRSYEWMFRQYSDLVRREPYADIQMVEHAWRQEGATESAIIADVLRQHGIDLQPADDFNPHCERDWKTD